jgi:hypothetical protein
MQHLRRPMWAPDPRVWKLAADVGVAGACGGHNAAQVNPESTRQDRSSEKHPRSVRECHDAVWFLNARALRPRSSGNPTWAYPSTSRSTKIRRICAVKRKSGRLVREVAVEGRSRDLSFDPRHRRPQASRRMTLNRWTADGAKRNSLAHPTRSASSLIADRSE